MIEDGNFLFKGGSIFDSTTGEFYSADLLIEDGIIKKMGRIGEIGANLQVIDAKDQFIVPGLIDIHVHLREPGREDKETIETGAQAAMAGGFTAVCCMPNTYPALDNRSLIEFVKKQARGLLVDVFPIGAVTKERAGKELTEMGDMLEAGAVAFSDDGDAVANAEIMRYALEYSHMLGAPIIDHCEDPFLVRGKVMNEGKVSTLLGQPGASTVAEDLIVARDIMLAEFSGGHVHIAHISSGKSVDLVRAAKSTGIKVTAEVCPHHLVLTDEAVKSFDSNLRVNPPIRTEKDAELIIEGLKDGTIDAIASDHAPHTIEDKDVEFAAAAPGMVGLETSVGLVLTHLVKKKHLSLARMVEKMAIEPRRILNLPVPEIQEGQEANLTLLNATKEWKVDKTKFRSKSHNTPFHDWQLTGRSTGVFNHGQWYANSQET
ncbi:MAG: dihydroorotase [bacterium]